MSIPDLENIKSAWTISHQSALEQLQVDPESGLSSTEAARQIRRRNAMVNVDVSFPNGTATNNHFK